MKIKTPDYFRTFYSSIINDRFDLSVILKTEKNITELKITIFKRSKLRNSKYSLLIFFLKLSAFIGVSKDFSCPIQLLIREAFLLFLFYYLIYIDILYKSCMWNMNLLIFKINDFYWYKILHKRISFKNGSSNFDWISVKM